MAANGHGLFIIFCRLVWDRFCHDVVWQFSIPYELWSSRSVDILESCINFFTYHHYHHLSIVRSSSSFVKTFIIFFFFFASQSHTYVRLSTYYLSLQSICCTCTAPIHSFHCDLSIYTTLASLFQFQCLRYSSLLQLQQCNCSQCGLFWLPTLSIFASSCFFTIIALRCCCEDFGFHSCPIFQGLLCLLFNHQSSSFRHW